MKHIGNLKYAEGARHKKKRIGRGPGSGFGGTSTKGNNGQQSRSGARVHIWFEGGQMPLNRRLPKFGFYNRNRVEYQIVNVGKIQELIDKNKLEDNKVNFDVLYKIGIINKKNLPLKILGNGNLNSSINIEAHSISASARQKIESAGGTVAIHE
jgi:large subunit ribosomal protein L15